MREIKIPVGISDFKEIREGSYYYIDKTGLISRILKESPAKVILITRPRRFRMQNRSAIGKIPVEMILSAPLLIMRAAASLKNWRSYLPAAILWSRSTKI